MRQERRVCVVLYKMMDGHPRYAVLKRTLNWEGWELPKGHLEDDDRAASARTEVAEETGITELASLSQLDYDYGWTYEEDGETVKVCCDCFLAEAPADALIDVSNNPHDEHEKGHFLNFRDARDILTHDDQRELLQYAHGILEEH